MAIDKNDGLISLADAKRYMRIATTDTDDDRLIDAQVMQASIMIREELGYNIKSRSYREFHSGDGGYYLWLDNVPVTSVDMASTGRDDVLTVEYGGGDAAFATVEVTDSKLRLRKKVSGTTSTNELVLSDYTITSLGTAITALSGWTATVTDTFGTYPAADLVPQPGRHAEDAEVQLAVPEAGETDYELEDGNVGRIYNSSGWDSGHKNVVVEYTAGYDAVPEPIESACMELVKMLYDLSKKDTSLKSERLGDYAYTTGDRLGAVFSASGDASTSNQIMMKIAPYRRKMARGL